MIKAESYEAFQALFKTVNRDSTILPGGNRGEAIPEPIPNSEVKLSIADGTARKSAGE